MKDYIAVSFALVVSVLLACFAVVLAALPYILILLVIKWLFF